MDSVRCTSHSTSSSSQPSTGSSRDREAVTSSSQGIQVSSEGSDGGKGMAGDRVRTLDTLLQHSPSAAVGSVGCSGLAPASSFGTSSAPQEGSAAGPLQPCCVAAGQPGMDARASPAVALKPVQELSQPSYAAHSRGHRQQQQQQQSCCRHFHDLLLRFARPMFESSLSPSNSGMVCLSPVRSPYQAASCELPASTAGRF